MSKSFDLVNRLIIISSGVFKKPLTQDQIHEVLFLAEEDHQAKHQQQIVDESFITGADSKPKLQSVDKLLTAQNTEKFEEVITGVPITAMSTEAYISLKFATEKYLRAL